MAARTHIGMLLFPGMTQLDFTGPYEVLARLPEAAVHVVATARDPVPTERGLMLTPTTTYGTCPRLDVIVVPGGPGTLELMQDDAVLDFLRREAGHAKYVTSVCTGAFVLGAAGLLTGYRATTHWLSLPLLGLVGAVPVDERIVIDGNRITGGGVTAGIDFALAIAAALHGEAVAQQIQLQIEYEPAPPFRSGSPRTAPAPVVKASIAAARELQERRTRICRTVAERLLDPLSTGSKTTRTAEPPWGSRAPPDAPESIPPPQ
ncbi:MAG TPA: DJ-1/PfpI family protein [Gammaproteobacteria bacterium]|nr:DJ-1/PfpI family protein [Gammaproteobacteria bacterium]